MEDSIKMIMLIAMLTIYLPLDDVVVYWFLTVALLFNVTVAHSFTLEDPPVVTKGKVQRCSVHIYINVQSYLDRTMYLAILEKRNDSTK